MNDPRLYQIWTMPHTSRARGLKGHRVAFELAGHVQFSRRYLKTDDMALAYGKRVITRWARLWDAMVKRVREAVTA